MTERSRPMGGRAAGRLGIDLGTTSVKVMMTDPQGQVLALTTSDYPVDHPHPGWAETHPRDWVDATAGAVRQVVRAAGVLPDAIGLSGQMHGVVLTGADLSPVRPAMLWSDSRATAQAQRYRDLPVDSRDRLGNPIVAGMAGPMLAWAARHEPQALASTRWALQPKDWFRAWLTGEVHTEPSDASATLLWNLSADTWDHDLVERLGIDPSLLPPVLPDASTLAGHLTTTAAHELGLRPGTPVAAGAADTAAAALGAGLVDTGTVQLTVGTGIQLITLLDDLPRTLAPTPVTHTYRTVEKSGWYQMAAGLNGGSTLAWVRQILGLTWAELYDTASLPPREDDPVFLPQLHGERTPYLDAGMRGAWLDLSPRHDRSRLARAALEGVAISIRVAFDCLHPASVAPTTAVRLAGGGTVATDWRQMLADSLDRPLQAVDVNAASAYGATQLGHLAIGGQIDTWSRHDAAAPTVAEPDSERTALLAERTALTQQRIHSLAWPPA